MKTPQTFLEICETTNISVISKYARFQHIIAMCEFCSQKNLTWHIEAWEKREDEARLELTMYEAKILEMIVMSEAEDTPIHQVVDFYGKMLDMITNEHKAHNSRTYGNRH